MARYYNNMSEIPTVYDELDIRAVKLRVAPTARRRGDVYATLAINNKGRHIFRRGTIVNKVGLHLEGQTRVCVWPFGPTRKEILMLKDAEVPYKIKQAEMRILFYDPGFERGLNVGGKFYDLDFKDAEVEYP